MPPKSGSALKKQLDKQGSKIVEDKTFGLKNKNKSKKVQAYVESVHKQVETKVANKLAASQTKEMQAAAAARKLKEQAAAAEKELQALMRSSIRQPKLEPGVDPKSVICEFFKAGCCEKGDKCKFSHDLTLARKAAKRDIYNDGRAEDDKKADSMENWDQAKLEQVVKTKHGAEKRDTKTDIVCMYFLDALERELYGWFWECPNGAGCKYKHALPPGYTFMTKKEKEIDAAMKAQETLDQVTLEEILEEKRKALPTTGLTPVTAESFEKWREDRARRRAAEMEAKRIDEAKRTGTKGYSALSGRALFSFDPSLFKDDEAGADTLDYEEEDGDDEEAAGDGPDDRRRHGSGGVGEGDEEEEEEEDEDTPARAGAGGDDAAVGAIDSGLFEGGDGDLDDDDDDDDDSDDGGGGDDDDGDGEE